MKARFLDLHLIQPMPYSNLNRDDLGSPKTVLFGGVERTRVSSQSWKRAVRLHIEDELGDEAVRTRRVVFEVAGRLQERGFDEELALAGARQLFASIKTDGLKLESNKTTTSVLLYLPSATLDRLADLVAEHREQVAAELKAKKPTAVLPADQVTALLSERNPTISLFGRMLAELPETEVDGAVQVAHAFTTHGTDVEVDFFTAVDDLNPEGTRGSGHMNSAEFAAGVFYRYACLDLDGLAANLDGDAASLDAIITAYLRALISALPTGKRNATAPNTLPDLVYAAVRADRPLSLAGAYERPVRYAEAGGFGEPSRLQLSDYAAELNRLWGSEDIVAHAHASIDAKAWAGLGDRHDSYRGLITTAVAGATGQMP